MNALYNLTPQVSVVILMQRPCYPHSINFVTKCYEKSTVQKCLYSFRVLYPPSESRGTFSKCLSLIHHNDSYAFENGVRRFYMPNVEGVNYNFKTESQYVAGESEFENTTFGDRFRNLMRFTADT